MLKVVIPFESSWGNSFLSGDNNAPLDKKNNREYVAALSNLSGPNGEKNFIRRDITLDTVMGVLNRLLGDQRKLYQARNSDTYFFKDIEQEERVSFEVTNLVENEETVFLRNLKNSLDKSSFSGMIDTNRPLFKKSAALKMWSVFHLSISQLHDLVVNNNTETLFEVTPDPLAIINHYETTVSKVKNLKIDSDHKDLNMVLEIESVFKNTFGQDYRSTAGDAIQVYSLYCSGLYWAIEQLSKTEDVEGVLTKLGSISGVSKRGVTPRDLLKSATTGKGKIIFGNPYFTKKREKGLGEWKEGLTKRSGTLVISLDIDREKAQFLKSAIQDAGVMSFPMGKKGLAYVEKLEVVYDHALH